MKAPSRGSQAPAPLAVEPESQARQVTRWLEDLLLATRREAVAR